MAKFKITSPDGQSYEVNAPEGATEQDAIEYVQNNLHAPKAETSVMDEIKKIPRQLGLAARYGVQGLADTAGIFSDPLSAVVNKAAGTELKPLGVATSNLLDTAGLPSPETPTERNVGEASKLLAGTGGFIKGAALAPKLLAPIASRPGLQAGSAVGAGYAGNDARERGAGGAEQFGASLLGGLGVPLSVAGLDGLISRGGQAIKNMVNPNALNNDVESAIRQAGVEIETLPNTVKTQIRTDVQKALQTGKQTSPDAIRRLADYRAVNAVPMRGNLTLNPADITRDKNLAKLGANSEDLVANSLANLQNRNNSQLINGLNDLGANPADDLYSAGQKVISSLDSRDKGAKGVINNFYNQARATNGRSANIDPHAFTNEANNLLDDALLGGKLPNDVRNRLNSIAKGETPLTVDVAEQFKTNIGALQRNSNDPAERMALGQVRQALDNASLLDGQGQEAINAFNKARKVNASYMANVEKTPALKAVRDGIEPDKFVNQFIIGNGAKSNVLDVAMLKKNIKGDQEATDAIRGQILAHLKGKGVNGAADEVANFSPSGYNKALGDIGTRKLNMFFSPEEVEQLNRIGRVASYENVQPKGSAVNNSNTAGALFSYLIDGIGKYVPLGEAIVAKPVKNISTSIKSRQSLNTAKALTVPNQSQPMSPLAYPLTLPLSQFGSGLLSTE